jgi:hypothetical protein
MNRFILSIQMSLSEEQRWALDRFIKGDNLLKNIIQAKDAVISIRL